jgi:hypothetical protein
MLRLFIFFAIAFFLFGCNNYIKDDSNAYKVINSVIDYHKNLINKNIEVFPDSGDTISYEDFVVIPKISHLLALKENDSELYFTLKGAFSKGTIFRNYFSFIDTSYVRKQLNKIEEKNLESERLKYNLVPYNYDFESYFQADSLIDRYKKDVIFFSWPIFNLKENLAIICYVYLKKSYQIRQLVLLKKDPTNKNWIFVKQYGLVSKFVPENGNWSKDSVFYTVYVGSISK